MVISQQIQGTRIQLRIEKELIDASAIKIVPKEPTCVSGSQSEAVNPLFRGCWDVQGIFLVVLFSGGFCWHLSA